MAKTGEGLQEVTMAGHSRLRCASGGRGNVRARARGGRSIGDARSGLSKLRPENNQPRKEKRRDEGYLRVDDSLLKDSDGVLEKMEEGRSRPAGERRFNDSLARNSSEFIWNSDWRKELDTWERSSSETGTSTTTSSPQSPQSSSSPSPEPGQRGISFSRLSELNDLSVDLSEQLRPRAPEPVTEDGASTSRGGRKDFLDFPARTSSGSSSGSQANAYAAAAKPLDPESQALANQQYSQTKGELFAYTLLTGLATGYLCNQLYGHDVAVSYGVGCAASLFYLRLLSRTVDAVAAEDAAAQVGGAGGQARLLVPAILVLGYSKCNAAVLENYGVQLNIIAILAGFFTYKAGTFGQVLKSTLSLVAEDKRANK